MFYTRQIDTRGAHVVEQALSVVSALAGRELRYVPPLFPLHPAAERWADELKRKAGGRPIAIVNPGAGWGAKCWPAESYGVVARALSQQGMTVMVNHGPGEEPQQVVYLQGLALQALGRNPDAADAFALALERGPARSSLQLAVPRATIWRLQV